MSELILRWGVDVDGRTWMRIDHTEPTLCCSRCAALVASAWAADIFDAIERGGERRFVCLKCVEWTAEGGQAGIPDKPLRRKRRRA